MTPEWLNDTVRAFGRQLGLGSFALNERGSAGVRFENGISLMLEHAAESLFVSVRVPVEPSGENLKALPLTVRAPRPVTEAIVTRGGVSVKEIDPAAMRSKLIPNLYFAGEMIDVDAHTGGFNLQIAWSTGALAGASAGHAHGE